MVYYMFLPFLLTFRENDYSFATKEGRSELALSVGSQRLLLVTMSRGHTYVSVDDVKAELSQKVMQFAPAGTKESQVSHNVV